MLLEGPARGKGQAQGSERCGAPSRPCGQEAWAALGSGRCQGHSRRDTGI